MTSPKLAIQTDHGRMYSRRVGGEATVPSITTIIGMDHVDLTGWAGYMAAKSLSEDARLAASISELGRMRSLVRDSATAAESYREAAAARGDRGHNYAEQWTLAELGQPHELDSARQLLQAHGEQDYAAHFESWWRDYRVEPVAAEVTVWNESIGYAGTIDLVAKIGGRDCLVDYKTKTSDRDGFVKRPDDKVIMQLAAACKAEERVADAEAGQWEPWRASGTGRGSRWCWCCWRWPWAPLAAAPSWRLRPPCPTTGQSSMRCAATGRRPTGSPGHGPRWWKSLHHLSASRDRPRRLDGLGSGAAGPDDPLKTTEGSLKNYGNFGNSDHR